MDLLSDIISCKKVFVEFTDAILLDYLIWSVLQSYSFYRNNVIIRLFFKKVLNFAKCIVKLQ